VALNEGLIRVPLIIAGPGIEDTEIDAPVSLIDLPNTLLKLSIGETEEGLDSRADMLGEDRREVVLAERDSGKSESSYAKDVSSRNPPKDLDWYRMGRRAAIGGNSKVRIDSRGGESHYKIDGYIQQKAEIESGVAKRLCGSLDELGSFSEEVSESVDEEAVKQELEKLGYN
jgi:hypothetical protein